jgi:hypothetical protein
MAKKEEAVQPAKRATTPTGRAPGRPESTTIDFSKTNTVPKLIITGRGQLNGRAMHAMRLQPELIERLKEVASGPTYLLVQVALEKMIAELKQSDGIQVIKAEDLG